MGGNIKLWVGCGQACQLVVDRISGLQRRGMLGAEATSAFAKSLFLSSKPSMHNRHVYISTCWAQHYPRVEQCGVVVKQELGGITANQNLRMFGKEF